MRKSIPNLSHNQIFSWAFIKGCLFKKQRRLYVRLTENKQTLSFMVCRNCKLLLGYLQLTQLFFFSENGERLK